MERRYLILTLALVATFAGLGRGLRSLEHYSRQSGTHLGINAGAQCPFQSPAIKNWTAKVRSRLHPANPEEAQMLAEMDLPFTAMQARVAQQAAEQAARCARETAQGQAERAQRQAEHAQQQAMRIQQKLAHIPADPDFAYTNFQFTMPTSPDESMEARAAVLSNKFATRVAKLQLAADNWQNAATRVYVKSITHAPCNTSGSKHGHQDVEPAREYAF